MYSSCIPVSEPVAGDHSAQRNVSPGKSKHAGQMKKTDPQLAGIPDIVSKGQYADFPALRHTFITNMMKSGVNPKTAQALARHSTIDLTMNVYTSLTVTDQAAAPNSLPAIPT